MQNNNPEKKRFRRGRKPGVPIDEYKKTEKTNDRPHLARFSVSLPLELGRMVRSLAPQLDLEFSKIFRLGVDHVVRKSLNEGKITKKFHDDYFEKRKSFRDEDWSGPE